MQKITSKKRGHVAPAYTRNELHKWLMANPIFHDLYEGWVNSGYKKEFAPSCDRKSSLLPYTFSNIQLVPFAQNLKNENEEMMKGIIGRAIPVMGINRTSGRIVTFVSGSEAQRKMGIHKNHISACCLGQRKSAGNYTWRYTA
jgi:hypothetical protein